MDKLIADHGLMADSTELLLQAAIGGIVLLFIFNYYRGVREGKKKK